ncbi:MAG TPA: ubiquinol oxidase subunit II [Allosphingosinicella sp.]|jgi:cytochrome o ubiquinol oxidase subunit 2
MNRRHERGSIALPQAARDSASAARIAGWRRGGGPVRFLLLAAAALLLAGCGPISVFNPAGPVADANRTITLNALAIMLAIAIPTMVATIIFAWWFRASNMKAEYRPDFVYSGRIELIVWSIPILVILFLGGVIWIGSHQLDPARPLPSRAPPVEVQVVSLDWKWLFIYPREGVASVNQLFVPTGVPVHFSLTSASVMNVFFVPRVGSMIYTMGGMTTQLNLRVDKQGAFYGRSAQFSGDGFPDMHFVLHSVPAVRFAAWTAAAKANGPVLDGPAYVALEKQSSNVAPFTYRAVAPGLFDAIVTHKLPSGPGPETGHGGAQPNVRPSFAG